MKITKKYLKKEGACNEGFDWFVNQNKTNPVEIIKSLITKKQQEYIKEKYNESSLSWANWLICRVMNKINKIKYAIYAAELVVDIYEKKYPNDDRLQKAIEAAKKYSLNPDNIHAAAANAAANAAYAAYAAYAAANAAYAAANAAAAAAAYAAANAAYAAAYAVYADCAAAAAADYAAAAAATNKKYIQIKILNYGIKLWN